MTLFTYPPAPMLKSTRSFASYSSKPMEPNAALREDDPGLILRFG
ncbi:hypothetical protein [Streptomyces sp. CC219B]|nr:hypothetical protein [Streptomyces sp. CC219B]